MSESLDTMLRIGRILSAITKATTPAIGPCRTCLYWRSAGESARGDLNGLCCRHAVTVDGFPLSRSDDECGEHAPKEKA